MVPGLGASGKHGNQRKRERERKAGTVDGNGKRESERNLRVERPTVLRI